MTHIISYHEKGKAVVNNNSHSNYSRRERDSDDSNLKPRVSRVRVQTPNNADLIRRHSLTLIGRVTNPEAQRMWSLIPVLSNLWKNVLKTSTRATGSDLGQGLFQLQFSFEEDIQTILDNRPYHFAQWMIIIQRWESILSPSFPSQIPFWIKVQGIPVHLWTTEIIRGVGKDLGLLETLDISPSAARMRVQVNGLQPLIMKSHIEFPDGNEIIATLVYEKLGKFCKVCNRLDHEKESCPTLTKTESRSSKIKAPGSKESIKDGRYEPVRNNDRNGRSYMGPSRPRESDPRASETLQNSIRSRRSSERGSPRRQNLKNSTYEPIRNKSYSRSSYRNPNERREPYGPDPRIHQRGSSASSYHYHSYGRDHSTNQGREVARQVWREKARSPIRQMNPLSENSRIQENNEQLVDIPITPIENLPQQAMEEAIGELRDVMIRYANCEDPTENAARRERVRLAEEAGEFEETAANMVRSALATQNQQDQSPQSEQDQQERISVSQRLGPTNEMAAVPAPRKRGRPPGAKKAHFSPSILNGACSKKRRVMQTQQSPKRRKQALNITRNEEQQLITGEVRAEEYLQVKERDLTIKGLR
ncbi:uncharacterized protein LOC112082099 [Eutrema salsugineum]|uniref:uncharacterized protein LOC112082099 n=1 Tax=Eutrema salsugineum TaxID=72664 RepID=UPI000CED403E|nr:uncharacterized protein LOC112082099 [Eutrema salsugineum]